DLRECVVARVTEGDSARGGCPVRGQRVERGEMVAALAGDGQCRGPTDGRQAARCDGIRSGLCADTPCRAAFAAPAPTPERTGRPRGQGRLRCALVLRPYRGAVVQKRPSLPPRPNGPTSPAAAPA